MPAVKLTKNELKKQKDSLKRFQRYLPTLILKKQQLQLVLRQIEQKLNEKKAERQSFLDSLNVWIGVFAEPVDIPSLLVNPQLVTDTNNIAGIDIPVFVSFKVDRVDYDFGSTPLWVDKAVDTMEALLGLDREVEILQKQYDLIAQELRVTSQRVNLFEKIKIPETKENIRVIRIYLGDQQTAAVVRGKMSKGKIEREASA